jgi:hypothetical protein
VQTSMLKKIIIFLDRLRTKSISMAH